MLVLVARIMLMVSVMVVMEDVVTALPTTFTPTVPILTVAAVDVV